MGLHSPFGYVGYVESMAQTIIDMLERFCGHCHTEDDYQKGCYGCPIGNCIYEAKDYITEAEEEDKHYALYASNEWQERRRNNNRPEETQEERDKWGRLSKACKPESIALRGLKRALKTISPHPFYYGQWMWDSKRNPDPLAKFKEYLEDYKFHSKRMYEDFRISGEINNKVRARLREELLPIIQKLKSNPD